MGIILATPMVGFPVSSGMTPLQQMTNPLNLGPQLRMGATPNNAPAQMAANAAMDSGAGTLYTGPLSQYSGLGQPFAVWLGMIALLGLLSWFSMQDKTLGGANPAHVRVGGYNFLTIGVIAAVFISLLKIVFNRFQVPGFTEFANSL